MKNLPLRCPFLSHVMGCGIAAFALINLAQAARAHILDQVTSIHFNSGQPDFGTLPRRAILLGENDVRPAGPKANEEGDSDCSGNYDSPVHDTCLAKQELTPEHADSAASASESIDRRLRHDADTYVEQGNLRHALRKIKLLAAHNGWNGDLRDRVEVLTEAITSPGPSSWAYSLNRYWKALNKTYRTDGQIENAARTEFAAIAADPQAAFLRPHALYQIGALYAGWLDYPRAITTFKQLLHDYPRSVKREAALIMIARAALLPTTTQGRNVAAGTRAIHEILATTPPSRFRRAALGLRARIDFCEGRYSPAISTYFTLDDLPSVEWVLAKLPARERDPYYEPLLAAYLRQLNRADTYDHFDRAIGHVRGTMALLSPAGATAFVAQLRRDPSLCAPYFYYRLYHCENKPRDITRLANLAARVASSQPNGGRLLPALVQIRFAEVAYQEGNYPKALDWAQKARVCYRGHGVYDRAIYVIGASLHKLGRDRESLAVFESLLNLCPVSSLRFSAREELALLREASGDLGGALDEYFHLNYRPDIAFFLDGRMTTHEVAAYVARHPRHKEHDLLVYSLGIRYLRDENWDAARECLESLPHATYVRFGKSADDEYGYHGWDDSDGPNPLKAIAALAALKRAVIDASTRNQRATALFRYARFYYNAPLLLLYNGALWRGDREVNFDFCWNATHATKRDRDVTAHYMHDHETYARAERICLQIARDYPDSPTRPYALYRAACCDHRLSNFNDWWRNDETEDYDKAASRLMARLAREYPRHALAAEARKFAQVWKD